MKKGMAVQTVVTIAIIVLVAITLIIFFVTGMGTQTQTWQDVTQGAQDPLVGQIGEAVENI